MHIYRSLVVATLAALAATASAAVAMPQVPDSTLVLADVDDLTGPGPVELDGGKTDEADAENTFVLKTRVKSGQTGVAVDDNLFVYAYHTAAGLNDAMLTAKQTTASHAVTEPGTASKNMRHGSGTKAGPTEYFQVVFFLGGAPYELMPVTGATPYPGLLPVRINVNETRPTARNSFYFENDSLQWTDHAEGATPVAFGGWLACKSEHNDIGNPSAKGTQLFYRHSPGGGAAPAGCANVDLIPIF